MQAKYDGDTQNNSLAVLNGVIRCVRTAMRRCTK